MNQDQFSAMLAIIIPPIIDQIVKNSNILKLPTPIRCVEP